MNRSDEILASPRLHFFSGAALAALWLLFAAAHISAFMRTGKVSLLLFCIAETAVAVFLLIRTQPKTFSRRPIEWAVALLGTFAPLFLRPTENPAVPAAEWGVVIGATIQIAGALSLNRSFALVPALRELKTHGMYSVVRHPLYASYIVTFSSYLAANFSIRNLTIFTLSVSLLIARIVFEERLLGEDRAYREYQRRVRWRLLPFIF